MTTTKPSNNNSPSTARNAPRTGRGAAANNGSCSCSCTFSNGGGGSSQQQHKRSSSFRYYAALLAILSAANVAALSRSLATTGTAGTTIGTADAATATPTPTIAAITAPKRRETKEKQEEKVKKKEERVKEKVKEKVKVKVKKKEKAKEKQEEEKKKHEICFVTSAFAASREEADDVADVSEFLRAAAEAEAGASDGGTQTQSPSSMFGFFAYTNLPELRTPGWEKVLLLDLPYRRTITKSRYPKFVPWMEHTDGDRDGNATTLSGGGGGKVDVSGDCGVVFYTDGYSSPRPDAVDLFRSEARRIRSSTHGLAQHLHPLLPTYEKMTWTIVYKRKDTKANVDATMAWLRNQSDFYERYTPLYWNRHIGYDPSNRHYRKVSSYFWNEYSKEIGSWRDQLLWAYAVKKFHVKPLHLADGDLLFDSDKSRMGHGGHVYVDSGR